MCAAVTGHAMVRKIRRVCVRAFEGILGRVRVWEGV